MAGMLMVLLVGHPSRLAEESKLVVDDRGTATSRPFTIRQPRTGRNLAAQQRHKMFAEDVAGLRQMDTLMWHHRNRQDVSGVPDEKLLLADVQLQLSDVTTATTPWSGGPDPPAWLLHPVALLAALCVAMAVAVTVARSVMLPIARVAEREVEQDLVPDIFICPISCEIMRDPVFTATGNTYERDLIAKWLYTHGTDPLTNESMCRKTLTPNLALCSAIAAWTAAARG